MLKDLGDLTGEITVGDITPMMARFFAKSPYKRDLLNYIGYCEDYALKKKLRELRENVTNREAINTMQIGNLRHGLAEWIAKGE